MVFSEILLKYPYQWLWKLKKLFRKEHFVVFYIESQHDYQIIKYVLPHIRFPFLIAAKSATLAGELKSKGTDAVVWPVFPDVVIMARHAFHRFPARQIKKIGLRHGPYHFKKMIASHKYNLFDLYLFTSENEVKIAGETGITVGRAGGYPRLDAFNDNEVVERSIALKKKYGFNNDKKTLLFAATWDRSGMSAVEKWADRLHEPGNDFNILVSLHPMMSEKFKKQISRSNAAIIASEDLSAGMLLADILVSDTSSVLAEFCVLDKPIITFKVPTGLRLTKEIQQMISEISLQIDRFEQLADAISKFDNQPLLKKAERQKWNRIIFDDLHTSHGLRAATIINDFVRKDNQ
jgi:CDP-glycerol glycerophosphotransferase (TagB/SpsB family)